MPGNQEIAATSLSPACSRVSHYSQRGSALSKNTARSGSSVVYSVFVPDSELPELNYDSGERTLRLSRGYTVCSRIHLESVCLACPTNVHSDSAALSLPVQVGAPHDTHDDERVREASWSGPTGRAAGANVAGEDVAVTSARRDLR